MLLVTPVCFSNKVTQDYISNMFMRLFIPFIRKNAFKNPNLIKTTLQ